MTGRRWPAELAAPPAVLRRRKPEPEAGAGDVDRSVSTLLWVLLAYQVLSALGTQFADYMLFDRAAARFTTSEELARFTAHFNVLLYLVQLIFVFVFAGPFLKRFGIRFGLLANPTLLGVAVLVALVAGTAGGVGSLGLFLAFGAARIGDITLTNSTTRTAINTTYQALPPHLRAGAQARTEGVGVPVAIGLSGASLIVVVELLERGVLTVAAVTLAICVLWSLLALVVFRSYGRRLHETLGHRNLEPFPTTIPDPRATLTFETVGAGRRDIDRELDDPARRGAALCDLRRDPEQLAQLIENHRGTGPADDRRLIRLLRCCGSADAALAAAVVARLEHRSREVVAVAARQLPKLLAPDDPRRAALASAIVGSAATDGAEIVNALDRLPDDERFRPLREALDDEAGWAADRALSGLALCCDQRAIARAREWLAGPDARQVATALETLQVNAPPDLREAAMAVLMIGRDHAAAVRGLRAATEDFPDEESTAGTLADLVGDPRSRWRSPWIAACARHGLESPHR